MYALSSEKNLRYNDNALTQVFPKVNALPLDKRVDVLCKK